MSLSEFDQKLIDTYTNILETLDMSDEQRNQIENTIKEIKDCNRNMQVLSTQ